MFRENKKIEFYEIDSGYISVQPKFGKYRTYIVICFNKDWDRIEFRVRGGFSTSILEKSRLN